MTPTPNVRPLPGEPFPDYLQRVRPWITDRTSERDEEMFRLGCQFQEAHDFWEYHTTMWRDPRAFVRRLLGPIDQRHARDHARRNLDALIDDMDDALDFIGEFLFELRARHAAGDTLNDGEIDGVLDLACILGTDDDRDGEAA